METTNIIVLPDFLPYLLGIFGLLVLWQYYQIQTMKGRILAIDIFDRSGIRMYLYAVADLRQACEVCRSAHGVVYPPSEVMKRQFSPIRGTCKTPARCIGFLVGLYGAWPDAERIVTRLQSSRKRKPIQLSQDELGEMVLGPWEQSISANTDRLASTYWKRYWEIAQIQPLQWTSISIRLNMQRKFGICRSSCRRIYAS